MTREVTLLPSAAVEHICHDEQMVVWSGDLVGSLSVAGFLRDDLDYSDIAYLHDMMKRELKCIIGAALDHPEARTILTRPKALDRGESPTIPIYRTSEAPNDNSKTVGDFTRVLKDQGMLDEDGMVKR